MKSIFFVPHGEISYCIVDKNFKLIHDFRDAYKNLNNSRNLMPIKLKSFNHLEIELEQDFESVMFHSNYDFISIRKQDFNKWSKKFKNEKFRILKGWIDDTYN